MKKLLFYALIYAVGSCSFFMYSMENPFDDFNVDLIDFGYIDNVDNFSLESFIDLSPSEDLSHKKRPYNAEIIQQDALVQESPQKKLKIDGSVALLLKELQMLEEKHRAVRANLIEEAKKLALRCQVNFDLIRPLDLNYNNLPLYEGVSKLSQDLLLKSKDAPFLLTLQPKARAELLTALTVKTEIIIKEVTVLEKVLECISTGSTFTHTVYPQPETELLDVIQLDQLLKESLRCSRDSERSRDSWLTKLKWLISLYSFNISKKFARQLGEESHNPLHEVFQKTLGNALIVHAKHHSITYKDFCTLLKFIMQDSPLAAPFIARVGEFLASIHATHTKLGLIKSLISQTLKASINAAETKEVFTCAICYEALSVSSKQSLSQDDFQGIVTPACACQNYYHKACLEKWIANGCPICKRKVGIQPIINPQS